MVLESLSTSFEARRSPLNVLIVGFIFALVSFAVATAIFGNDVLSLAAVFFTAMAATPLSVSVLKDEEIFEEQAIKLKYFPFRESHKEAFLFFMSLFFGFFFAFVLLSAVLPASMFTSQVNTINYITGGALASDVFWVILFNNLKVLGVFLIFSFVYGAGAVFILSWNASIVGVATGTLIAQEISSGLQIIPLAFMRYMTHGIFEVGAYLLAGIAGGILSAALIRKKLSLSDLPGILYDVVDLIIAAIILLIVGAIVEVTISPLILSG